jgi:hypothetical protein
MNTDVMTADVIGCASSPIATLFHKVVAIDPKWFIESSRQAQVSIKN